ncbi:Protein kintoun [Podochytrium sp. JEL0797]|nr:Protein kintoun [Podochytrium sp. JEL0797]
MATTSAPTESGSPLEKINVTKEEMDKIAKAMKDEKFRQLFKEYVDEISDPKNKELYEREITSLEADRGNSIRWIKPTPARVIKSAFVVAPGKQEASAGGEAVDIPADVKKVFVNICTCNEIEEAKPGEGKEEKGGRVGTSWAIPYSLTAGRFDQDKAGKKCFVYDCVFNPKTFELGCKMPKFMELLMSTALEGVERQFGVKLDHAFKPVKMNYKGSEIKATVVRTKVDASAKAAEASNSSSSEVPKKTSLDFIEKIQSQQEQMQKEESSKKPVARAVPASKTIITGNRYKATAAAAAAATSAESHASASAFGFADPSKLSEAPVSKSPLIQELSSTEAPTPSLTQSQNTLQTPTYTLTHRASLSYSNYLSSRDRSLTHPPRPSSLLLKIHLPLCESAQGVDFNIVENGWRAVLRVEGRYALSVELPFEVLEEKGTARFDKRERVLVVDVPCLQCEGEGMPESDAPMELDEVEEVEAAHSEVQPENVVKPDETRADETHEREDVESVLEPVLEKSIEDEETSDGENEQNSKLPATVPAVPLDYADIPGTLCSDSVAPIEAMDPKNDANDATTADPAPCNPAENLALSTPFISHIESDTEEPEPAAESDEDLFSALQHLTPTQPTQQELMQLAETAQKVGVLTSGGPAWCLKSVEEVLGVEDLEKADEVRHEEQLGHEVEGGKRMQDQVKLVSHLIYELDE